MISCCPSVLLTYVRSCVHPNGRISNWLAVVFYKKKVKIAHTRLPSVGSGADPGLWQSACR